jgi:hypothetical protein
MTEQSHVLDLAFDSDNEEGTPAYELIPPGKYTAQVMTASCGPTKNGKGQMVKLTWEITEGPYDNRRLFQNILIAHESPDAQKFGRQKFKDVVSACGVTGQVQDLGVLLNVPCLLSVGIEKDKTGEHEDKNRVSRVMPLKPPVTPGTGGKHDLNDSIPF